MVRLQIMTSYESVIDEKECFDYNYYCTLHSCNIRNLTGLLMPIFVKRAVQFVTNVMKDRESILTFRGSTVCIIRKSIHQIDHFYLSLQFKDRNIQKINHATKVHIV